MRAIGMNLNAVGDISCGDRLREMAAAGFEATFMTVLPAAEQAAAAALCAKHGIRCETLHAPFSHINDIWFPGENGDAMLRDMCRAADHCLIAGAKILVVHLSSGVQAPPVTDAGRRRFHSLVEYAAKRGIRIAFENQRKLANLAWALETFDAASAGFCWDCGHERVFAGGMRYMPLFGERLITTHIHDNFGIPGEDLHLIPFDGTVDFRFVAETLRNADYRGTLMLELVFRERYAGMSAAEYIARAAAAAKRLRGMLDGEGGA